VRRIEEHRNSADGSFDLRLAPRLDATDRGGAVSWTTASLQPFRVSRDDWLNVLGQVGYRRVLVAELEVPDAAMHPEVAKALDSYQEAQARFGLGDYRGAAVSIRHNLEALLDEAPDPKAKSVGA